MGNVRKLKKIKKLKLEQINDEQTVVKDHGITLVNWKDKLVEVKAYYIFQQDKIWHEEYVVLLTGDLYGFISIEVSKTTLSLFDEFDPYRSSFQHQLILTRNFDFTSSEGTWSELEEPLSNCD